MKFQHYDLGQRNRGEIVEVILSGTAANVLLMDSSNFSSYKSGRRCSFYGGHAKAFNAEHPLIAINGLRTGTEKSEQEGFMHLMMGAMAGMRNLYSHGDVKTMTPMDAFERLCFVSLLFKRVDLALATSTNKKEVT